MVDDSPWRSRPRRRLSFGWHVGAYVVFLTLGFAFLLHLTYGYLLTCTTPTYSIRIERAEEDLRLRPSRAFDWHEEAEGEGAASFREAIQEEIRGALHGSMNGACPSVTDGGSPIPDEVRDMKVFFAADLHNSDGVLAHWMVELLALVSHLRRENIFVSVYDSASSDTTPTWIMFLKTLLAIQQIPHHVVSDPFDARRPGQHRIDFMASIRNKALEPLPVLANSRKNLEHFSALSTGEAIFNGTAPDSGGAMFDRVVFLNDVFFCASDVIRLLLHDTDMACGMDYDTGTYESLLSHSLHSFQPGEAPKFYDTWVARDLEGKQLTKLPPHFKDPADQLKFLAGEPIPVQCCWNGLAVINAEPFHRGLRFRHARDGECKSSECSHFCDDLWLNDYRRIIIDPQVKLAYTWDDWVMTQAEAEPVGLDGKGGAVVPVDRLHPALPEQLTCCSMDSNTADKTSCKEVSFESVMAAGVRLGAT